MSDPEIKIANATADDLQDVYAFLLPYMDQEMLLVRSPDELAMLLNNGFVARCNGKVVGFSAVEVYSKKLAELQCLAVSSDFQRKGIGKLLVKHCIAVSIELGVQELMAISNSEDMFRACGFDYSLPHQKRAFFFQPEQADDA